MSDQAPPGSAPASREIIAAAIQMEAKLGNVPANLAKAERLIEEALVKGARLVIVPEFFTSAVAFHPSLLQAALPFQGKALDLLVSQAKKHQGLVGGSFIAVKKDGERCNTWVLAFPDGSFATHDKDLPTMWENCYYRGGSDPGVLRTPLGPVGAAMCWELIRTQTARRLRGQVDLLVAGSCWWTLPEGKLPLPFKQSAARRNLEIMRDTPARMARLLGVPVVHAAHAGRFEGKMPGLPGLKYRSHYLGETQIVDAGGGMLARLAREQGEGIIFAKIRLGRPAPSEEIPARFWIPKLHPMLKLYWQALNFHGRRYYRGVTKKI